MLPRNALTRASLAITGLFIVGCSAPVVDDVVDAGEETTQGVVLIERTQAEGGAAQTNVSAKFMRMAVASDPEAAERVVGTQLDLPAAGECVVMLPEGPAAEVAPSLAALGSIELLDVGDVTIKAGSTMMALAPRAFPDVGDIVSGVFYTSRDAASDLPAPASYVLEGSGSATIGGFAIEADAPAPPEGVRIDEHLLRAGTSIEEGSAAVISWGEGASGDAIYVDIASPVTGASIRCAFRDVGEGTIPASLLRSETLGALPSTVAVGVHRVRRSTFAFGSGAAAGVDLGEVRFDLGVVGHLVIEPATAL